MWGSIVQFNNKISFPSSYISHISIIILDCELFQLSLPYKNFTEAAKIVHKITITIYLL